jgi:thiol-disulfide isomerase/thioredoxin
VLLLGVGVLLVLVGCSGTTEVERAGRFAFVSPGGLSVLTYPAGERGTIGEISGPDVMSEATIAVSDYPDTVIVLNVWGSWCGPCRAEADSLNTAATASKDLPVRTLLAIQGFPTSSIPSTIILDRQHRVAQIFLRVVNTGELMQAIRPLATENSPAGTPPTDSPSSATSGPTASSDGGAG